MSAETEQALLESIRSQLAVALEDELGALLAYCPLRATEAAVAVITADWSVEMTGWAGNPVYVIRAPHPLGGQR